uniref:CHRNA7-FAM7A fusion protein n=1 Tax=Euleptes europaea TaxID=460621 RepID=UPI0025411B6E|nr:CHRNA7-FAM7A fusion protein [Euleptes europaea]
MSSPSRFAAGGESASERGQSASPHLASHPGRRCASTQELPVWAAELLEPGKQGQAAPRPVYSGTDEHGDPCEWSTRESAPPPPSSPARRLGIRQAAAGAPGCATPGGEVGGIRAREEGKPYKSPYKIGGSAFPPLLRAPAGAWGQLLPLPPPPPGLLERRESRHVEGRRSALGSRRSAGEGELRRRLQPGGCEGPPGVPPGLEPPERGRSAAALPGLGRRPRDGAPGAVRGADRRRGTGAGLKRYNADLQSCRCPLSLQGEFQRKLYKELLKNYNPLERPVGNDSQPLTVSFGLSLMQIMDVDEKNQVLTTNIWLHMYWTDYYLQWNVSDYPGVKNVRFPDGQIWKPDILLYNSADERFDATFHTNVLVNSSGYCQYLPPGIFKSSCEIDVRWFPFDVQKCKLKFGSWTYGGWSLDLQMQEADISGYISNGEWDLVGVPGKRTESFYDCCKEPYPDVTFTVTMRRRTLYYGLNLLIPCVLISALALLVFLLPADSGEKISLGITVLLSLTVFMLLVAEIMPATSDSVPLIAQYFASTMIIVGLSVVVTVIVLQYHHHDPDGGKMPKWTRIILLNWCAWFLRMKRPGEDKVRPACQHKRRCSLSSVEMNTVSGQQSSNGNMLYIGFRGLEGVHCTPTTDSGVICGRMTCSTPDEDNLLHSGHPSETDPDLTKILEEVRYIANRFRDQDEAEAICNEWKFAASVVDRLCLMAFSVFTIICTIGILMSAPNFVEAVSKDFA